MQKLIQILPQMNALQEFENCNNNTYEFTSPKQQLTERISRGYLAVRFIIQKNFKSYKIKYCQ